MALNGRERCYCQCKWNAADSVVTLSLISSWRLARAQITTSVLPEGRTERVAKHARHQLSEAWQQRGEKQWTVIAPTLPQDSKGCFLSKFSQQVKGVAPKHSRPLTAKKTRRDFFITMESSSTDLRNHCHTNLVTGHEWYFWLTFRCYRPKQRSKQVQIGSIC